MCEHEWDGHTTRFVDGAEWSVCTACDESMERLPDGWWEEQYEQQA